MARTRPAPPAETSRPQRSLSRERIVAEAVAMIDADGLDSLSMRTLAKRLGVDAMALYRYVNGREDLLEAVVEVLVEQIEVDPGDGLGPGDGWQGVLQWLARSVRAIAAEHPRVFPLVATRHPAAPWLRPPLRSLRVVDEFLRALTDRGLSDRQAVETYKIFTSFLLGTLLLEVAVRGAETSPVEEPLNEGTAPVPTPDEELDVEAYPAIARNAGLLSQDRADEEFEKALEALLDRLDRDLSQ